MIRCSQNWLWYTIEQMDELTTSWSESIDSSWRTIQGVLESSQHLSSHPQLELAPEIVTFIFLLLNLVTSICIIILTYISRTSAANDSLAIFGRFAFAFYLHFSPAHFELNIQLLNLRLRVEKMYAPENYLQFNSRNIWQMKWVKHLNRREDWNKPYTGNGSFEWFASFVR